MPFPEDYPQESPCSSRTHSKERRRVRSIFFPSRQTTRAPPPKRSWVRADYRGGSMGGARFDGRKLRTFALHRERVYRTWVPRIRSRTHARGRIRVPHPTCRSDPTSPREPEPVLVKHLRAPSPEHVYRPESSPRQGIRCRERRFPPRRIHPRRSSRCESFPSLAASR